MVARYTKLLENNLEKKLDALKYNLEKKIEKSEELIKENENKQKDYVYDKMYELRSKLRNFPQNQHSNECDKKINKLMKEQDSFNVKLNKVKDTLEDMSKFKDKQEDLCPKIPPQINSLHEDFEALQQLVEEKLSIREETQQNDFSTISEISTHPSENFDNARSPNIQYKDGGQAEQILECETPASLHRSFDELFPAENSADGSVHRQAIINRYRLDYTVSPEHSNERSSESESRQSRSNQSFLVKRPPGLSNLWRTTSRAMKEVTAAAKN